MRWKGLATGAAAAAWIGCTPPETPYRYTGVVPAARALTWDGRTAPAGSLRVEGHLSDTPVIENAAPVEHDTALWVPHVTAEGTAAIALTRGVELGARYAYASYAWTEPSARGTMPVPSEPSIWGLGPELRGTIPLDARRRVALGIAGNFMRWSTPYAEWKRDDGCPPGPRCVSDGWTTARYSLFTERSESRWTLAIAAYPSVALGDEGEYGHVFGGIAAHTKLKNDGFTQVAHNGSSIEDAGLLLLGGLGYGIKIEALRLAAMLDIPFNAKASQVRYGLSGFFSVGADLELWEPAAARRARRDREAQRPAPEP